MGLTPSHYAPNIFSPSSPVPVPFPNTTKPVKKLNLVYRETLRSNQHIIRHASQNTPLRSIYRPLFVPRSFKPTTQTNTKTLVFGYTHNSFPHSEFLYQYSLLVRKSHFVIMLSSSHYIPCKARTCPTIRCLSVFSIDVCICPSLSLCVCLSFLFLLSLFFVLYIKVTARRTLLSLIPLPFCLLRCVSKQFYIYLSVYLFLSFVARIEGTRRGKNMQKYNMSSFAYRRGWGARKLVLSCTECHPLRRRVE